MRALREITRYRRTQVVVRGQEIRRLDKSLGEGGDLRAHLPERHPGQHRRGRFADHHGAVARVILDHIDFLDAAIAHLDEEVVARLGALSSGSRAAPDDPRSR